MSGYYQRREQFARGVVVEPCALGAVVRRESVTDGAPI